MSYDLGVWYSSKRWSAEDATQHYQKLSEGRPKKSLVEPNARISKFVKELTAKYPQIDDASEEDVDNCPWNCALDISKSHCLMSISFSRAGKIAPFVAMLAKKYDLICYDPQNGKVQLPQRLRACKDEPQKYKKQKEVTIKVIKHLKPFDLFKDDILEMLDEPIKRLAKIVPFFESGIEVLEISVDPEVYQTSDGELFDEVHVFKNAKRSLWKFREYHCKGGVLRSFSDSGTSLVPFK